MMSAGHQVRAGQEARLIDVPADAGKGMGIFEDIHDSSSPDQFANLLTAAASNYYGTASIAFLERLGQDPDRVANAAKGFIAKFLATQVNPKAAGEIFRAARRFGLVAFAGECASDMGITGWPEGEATRSEEHTSELQSPCNLVCRLLLEKKKINQRQGYRWPRRAQWDTRCEWDLRASYWVSLCAAFAGGVDILVSVSLFFFFFLNGRAPPDFPLLPPPPPSLS